MHATVYNRDLEPITIVWLAPWAERMLGECGYIAFAASPPMSTRAFFDPCDAPVIENWVVRMRGEQLRLGRVRTWILIADDERLALLLRSAFLPGQRSAVLERERDARDEGVLMALSIIRRLGEGE